LILTSNSVVEESGRPGKYLGIFSPAKSLISGGTVSWDAEEVAYASNEGLYPASSLTPVIYPVPSVSDD
jgi:hypothetical protein